MKLNEAVDLFLNTYENPHTRKAYRTALSQMTEYIGPSRPVENLSTAHLIEYDNELRNRGLAPATVNQRRKAIKTFAHWLLDMEFVDKYVGKGIRVRRLARRQSRDKAMTDEEFELLRWYFQREARAQLAKIEHRKRWNHIRNHALLLLMGDTGCRIGGAASLTLDKLNLTEREAQLIEKGTRPHRTKFGHASAIALREWLLVRPPCDLDEVFISIYRGNLRPMQAENISQEYRRAARALQAEGHEIRVLSGHSLRHRKGHQMADAKVPPSIAATVLGHTSVLTTIENYYPDDYETAFETLEELAAKPDVFAFPKFGSA